MNRNAILKKLAAIKAKLEDKASTPAEVESFTRIYNDLMQKYNLTESDVHVRSEGVGFKSFKTGQTKAGEGLHEIAVISQSIAKVTETRAINSGVTAVVFFGTRPDVEYAEFLYRLCLNALETASKAFDGSTEHNRLVTMGYASGDVLRNFRAGFSIQLIERLDAIAAENERNKPTGNALILVKNELIQIVMDELGDAEKQFHAVVNYDHSRIAAEYGALEGDKVILRQQTEAQKVLTDQRED
jgi:hypothetical protein